MEKHENVYRNRKKMLIDNFLGGIVWALGVWVGTAIIVTILASVLTQINFVPIVGEFVSDVIAYIAQDRPFLPF